MSNVWPFKLYSTKLEVTLKCLYHCKRRQRSYVLPENFVEHSFVITVFQTFNFTTQSLKRTGVRKPVIKHSIKHNLNIIVNFKASLRLFWIWFYSWNRNIQVAICLIPTFRAIRTRRSQIIPEIPWCRIPEWDREWTERRSIDQSCPANRWDFFNINWTFLTGPIDVWQ